jgi:hypothetical protein
MPDFGLIDINQLSSQTVDVTRNFPPFVQQAVGDKLGQVGNSGILNGLQNIAARQGGDNPVISALSKVLLQQQSPFPIRKYVSFYMLDRNGKLAEVSPGESSYNFKPGYAFNMHVNPKNFKINLPAKTVVPARTLGGWRLQHWYPEIGSISATGIIGNMLERFNRDLKDSAAWFGFKKLMTIYQNNGIPYIPNGANANRTGAQNRFYPNAICIYDKVRYAGYFENLNYEESEDTPNTVTYDFSFKFLSMINVDDIASDSEDKSAIGSIKPVSVDSRIGNIVLPMGVTNSVISSFKFPGQ